MLRRGLIALVRRRLMPTLLELQQAFGRGLVVGAEDAAARQIFDDGLPAEARLAIYRHTVTDKLTTALRLTFPAVDRLVGSDFFGGAARLFIKDDPPWRADLATYGEGFPEFLGSFPPAASLPYLGGVARLEWAVACARHAADAPPLSPSLLLGIDLDDPGDIVFQGHPAIALIAAEYPVDAIWDAVLARNEAAMAAVDLASGPVRLLVERHADGIGIARLDDDEWRFAAALFASRPLAVALEEVAPERAIPLLAEHLAAGRLIGVGAGGASRQPEASEGIAP